MTDLREFELGVEDHEKKLSDIGKPIMRREASDGADRSCYRCFLCSLSAQNCTRAVAEAARN